MKHRRTGQDKTLALFLAALSKKERMLVEKLNSPNQIQLFLDNLDYASETIYRSPLRVMHERACQCFDGAVLGASLLRRIGYPAVVLDLLPNNRDDDHVLSLFRCNEHWGALAKSNFVGLRFREPVYKSIRELCMSYFENYYNLERERTLRGYTRSLDLKAFDKYEWMTKDETMDMISDRLDSIRRYPILTKRMIAGLSLVDRRSSEAGLYGSNKKGLSRPPLRKRHD